MYTLFALFAFVIAVSAKPSPRDAHCKSPKAWEGKEYLEIDSQNVSIAMKVSYDENNKRVRALLNYDPLEREIIILYKQRRMYTILHKTGKCVESSYDKPFAPAQIPKGATFAVKGYVGLKSHGLAYEAYYGNLEKGVAYVMSVLQPECVIMYVKLTYKGSTLRESISDMTLGIKDPSVFTPPKSCQQGPVPDFLKLHPRY